MKTGLLWYDGDPERHLKTVVEQAARRYHAKFESWPNTCHVHPASLGLEHQATVTIPHRGPQQFLPPIEIRVLPSPTVLRHHFWVGREEEVHDGAE